MSIFSEIENARAFLEDAGVFYETRKHAEEWSKKYPDGHKYHESKEELEWNTRTLNMNDTFGWATAYGVSVADEEMIEVATLFWRYGFNGLTYWCAEKEGIERSQFEDVTRGIEFVRHEEKIRKETPDSTDLAFKKVKYELG